MNNTPQTKYGQIIALLMMLLGPIMRLVAGWSDDQTMALAPHVQTLLTMAGVAVMAGIRIVHMVHAGEVKLTSTAIWSLVLLFLTQAATLVHTDFQAELYNPSLQVYQAVLAIIAQFGVNNAKQVNALQYAARKSIDERR